METTDSMTDGPDSKPYAQYYVKLVINRSLAMRDSSQEED